MQAPEQLRKAAVDRAGKARSVGLSVLDDRRLRRQLANFRCRGHGRPFRRIEPRRSSLNQVDRELRENSSLRSTDAGDDDARDRLCAFLRRQERQPGYLAERDGRIGWMRVVCSGFRPLASPE